MPSSVYLPNGWQLPIALRIHLTGPGAGFILLWAYSSLWGILVLPAAMGDVDALRAAGTYIPVPGWLGPGASTYNPVPGWLGPGAWLAYWLTTLAALARARRALFVEKTPAVDGAEPDADEAWDPDLTASALFTLFAAVALLGDSRARAGIDANRLVLCAESLAVLAGLCTGYLGSVFWLGVVQGPGLREGCLSAPGPLMRTALRRLATYGVLLVGSASVLLVFSLRMNSHVLLTAARERGYAVLVYDTLYEGSIARLALFVLLEFVVKVAAVLSSLARGDLTYRATLILFGMSLPSTGLLGLVLLLMGIPGMPSFPNSAISILELDQLAPLVTAGLVAAVRVFYNMRGRRQSRGYNAA